MRRRPCVWTADGQGGVKGAVLGAEQLRRTEGLVKAAADDFAAAPGLEGGIGPADLEVEIDQGDAFRHGGEDALREQETAGQFQKHQVGGAAENGVRSAPCRAAPGRRRWNRPVQPRPSGQRRSHSAAVSPASPTTRIRGRLQNTVTRPSGRMGFSRSKVIIRRTRRGYKRAGRLATTRSGAFRDIRSSRLTSAVACATAAIPYAGVGRSFRGRP